MSPKGLLISQRAEEIPFGSACCFVFRSSKRGLVLALLRACARSRALANPFRPSSPEVEVLVLLLDPLSDNSGIISAWRMGDGITMRS